MTRLLHLLNSSARGGRELYVCDLIVELQKTGVENFVLCRKHSVIDTTCQKWNIPVIYTSTNTKFSFPEVLRLSSFMEKNKITTLYSHSRNDVFTGSLIKWLSGIRHIHGIYMGTGPKKDLIHRFVYGRVDVLITSSEFSKRECENYIPVPQGAVKLIRYGRHINNYIRSEDTRQRIRKEMNTPDEKLVIAAMSRIDKGKGVDIFADSIQYLSPEEKERVEFWMMGEPTIKTLDENGNAVYEEQAEKLHSKLMQLSRENSDLFKLIPFQKDYISYLNGMDVFVLPTHNEMYSLSVIDAMLMGLPVIGTNAGGTTEQIGNDERGLLVTPGSSLSIAEAIRHLLNNPAETKLKGENAQTWALSQHDFTKTVEEVLRNLSDSEPRNLRDSEPLNLKDS